MRLPTADETLPVCPPRPRSSFSYPTLEQTKQEEWSYLAEGGASLVCSYTPGAVGVHERYVGKVLRLSKTRVVSADEEEEEGTNAVEWQDRVIARLLPEGVIPQLETVDLDPAWLQKLAERIEPLRPAFRRTADQIDLTAATGVLAADLIGGNAIAVEIKPKWAFLPSPQHLSPSTRALKTQHCRYCMHKQLRALSSKPTEAAYIPTYCPLDLYSGEESRVRRALEQLWEDWMATGGRLNNFRVFVRGERVDPSHPGSLARLERCFPLSSAKQALLARLLPLLLLSPILQRLKHLQRTLDPWDIEGLSALSRALHPSSPLGEGQTQPRMGEWEAFVREYLAGKGPTEEDKGGEEELRWWVMAYTLGATFKDCSLIVRLPLPVGPSAAETEPLQDGHDTGMGRAAAAPEEEEEEEEEREEGGGHGEGSVWVIDTGVKSVGKLRKWEELDREVVEGFRRSGAGGRCVE
ncbi:hypothetical protein CALCODRAFT_501925 [Calocera cornea HHB12733]|uniref:Inositol-pentakisphosphate 2-kinase n=1 Tax=Calocera cornea HHB12733 TaxID=1353952 RepID=A0A165DGA3_9BASI|nr:hypothetical protein CALCODRAFT_501925 [Calocera cornea HHB12733]